MIHATSLITLARMHTFSCSPQLGRVYVLAAGPTPRTGRGQDKATTGPQSHNNEKDFARRLEAWNKLKADEEEDMGAKVML